MSSDRTNIVQRYRPLAELMPAHWRNGAIETEDGAQVRYLRSGGAKPAVLLLHGVQASGAMWLRTAQALEAEYDVVMPDARGHGQSSRVGVGVSTDTLVNDTQTLLRELAIERPFIVGHSMGAEIAGRLAAVHPARGLVLVDPGLRNFAAMIAYDPDKPPPWMAPIFEALQALKTQSHTERMATGLRLLPPGTPPWGEADYVGFVDGMAHFEPAFFTAAAKMGYLFEDTETIARIACPVLLLTARPMMPGMDISAGVAAFEQHWRDGRRIHFEDSGHFIPFDQFERFVETLKVFFETH